MTLRHLLLASTATTVLALGLACGGGGSDTLAPPATDTGTVAFLAQDAASETWSNVGVILRRASLVRASDAAATDPVVIYDGSQDTVPVNLLQLDGLQELLGQVSGVPAGTYDRLILEVDGLPADITLVPAADPGTGVVPAPIPASRIVVKGDADPSHPDWRVLPTVKLASSLTVTRGSAGAVAVDVDLTHPAFIVEHDTLAGDPLYVVNFDARNVFRHAPAASLGAYYLRRHLGTVATVAADQTSFTLTTDHGKSFTILPDSGRNPSLFYDLDEKPAAALATNSVPSTLKAGMAVECTARFQADGSLTAVRVWYAAAGTSLPRWTPEGHVTRVDPGGNLLYVLGSKGDAQPIAITAATKWYFKGDASTDLSGGDGTTFLGEVDRFFKVHVTLADPDAAPVTAASVDIQRGVFEGTITSADASGFAYHKVFGDGATSDHALGYAPAFSFWDFTFPALATSDIPTFMASANSGIILDTSSRAFTPYGASTLDYDGGATVWDAKDAVILPTAISALAQTVSAGYSGGALQVRAKGAAAVPFNVTLDASGQEQPLVTLYARSGLTVAVSVLDPSQWDAALTAGTKVRVYGVPDGHGNLKAYYVNIYQ